MSVVSGMTERERIAYRRGSNDGLVVMRERITEFDGGDAPGALGPGGGRGRQ
jgi:hypothetical protein